MNVDWELVVAITAALIAAGALVVAWLTKAAAERSADIASDALEVARESAESSKLSAEAANRSAAAEEKSLQLEEGQAEHRVAHWEIEKVQGSTDRLFGTRKAKIFNTGGEVALSVRVTGERLQSPVEVESVPSGRFVEITYDAGQLEPGAFPVPHGYLVEWERPTPFDGDPKSQLVELPDL
ncbi:hypothetical protein KGD82_13770 [Nocardiopsis eucommiae]|uniref:Uncharacterized protein n=1 Tax=Nocardiopsis eucommiae TaxID=2831970 RepID=A0A975LCS4_9ACTN|nr:hypothetical protein KGD82_13770 [Nocardiopsis eucommiae]